MKPLIALCVVFAVCAGCASSPVPAVESGFAKYRNSRDYLLECVREELKPLGGVASEDMQEMTITSEWQVRLSPFDREGLLRARDAVAASGWMSSVTQVRRSDHDEVIVEGTWAIPFALVRDADGDHLVDTRGRLLPRSYAAGKGPRLLRIEGVPAPRPSSFGSTWTGDEVTAALAMAAAFADRPWRQQVTAVVMDGWARDSTIRLRTDRGGEILWGCAPGREAVSEVPALQKLGALQLAFDRTGHIAGGAAESLDLRGDVTLGR